CWRGQPAAGDLVPGELQAGLRIKNITSIGAKTPARGCYWRNGQQARPADLAASALIVTKEEEFVLPDRAADRSPKLVSQGARYEFVGQRVRLELRERVPRLKHIVLPKIEDAAMKSVRPRFGLHGYNPCDGLAKLCIVVL